MERMEAVKATGIADEVIVEEYEGQKIDDIMRYGVDIFAIGSDWKGNERWAQTERDLKPLDAEVVYLQHTDGISSTFLREKENLKIEE